MREDVVDDGEVIEDDVVEDDDQGQKQVGDDFQDQENDELPGGLMCGAGSLGMIPAMMFGLCGMRPRRRQ